MGGEKDPVICSGQIFQVDDSVSCFLQAGRSLLNRGGTHPGLILTIPNTQARHSGEGRLTKTGDLPHIARAPTIQHAPRKTGLEVYPQIRLTNA
jgi:hypothetical protein